MAREYKGPDARPVGDQIINHLDVDTERLISPFDLGRYEAVETVQEFGRGLPRTNIWMKLKNQA